MSTNDNTTPTLNCFVHKETINDIFPVVVDNTMDVEKLRNEIKRVRPNLSQINFDLYEAHDFTPNYRIVNNVNSKDIPDEESVFMDPIEKISKYFPHLKLGIPKPSPQPLDDGRIGHIDILIYPQKGVIKLFYFFLFVCYIVVPATIYIK